MNVHPLELETGSESFGGLDRHDVSAGRVIDGRANSAPVVHIGGAQAVEKHALPHEVLRELGHLGLGRLWLWLCHWRAIGVGAAGSTLSAGAAPIGAPLPPEKSNEPSDPIFIAPSPPGAFIAVSSRRPQDKIGRVLPFPSVTRGHARRFATQNSHSHGVASPELALIKRTG